jgi:hypothetical protein
MFQIPYLYSPLPTSNNRITPTVILRHPHIRINCCTKRRKTRTPQRRSLRPSALRQKPSRQAPRRNPVSQIILGSVTFNRTLGTREYRADISEVFGRGPGGAAHFFESLAELFFDWEGGDGGAGGCGCHRSVVAHGGHEEAEDAAEAEAHDAGHGEFAGA